MTSTRVLIGSDADVFAGDLVLPDVEADRVAADSGAPRRAATLWATSWTYDDLGWVALHRHHGSDPAAAVVELVARAVQRRWPDDLVLDLTDLMIGDVEIDDVCSRIRVLSGPTAAVHLFYEDDPGLMYNNAVCAKVAAGAWTPARAYCGEAHHPTWRVPADLLPGTVRIFRGTRNEAYHLVRHPRTGSAARDHRGNHVYTAAAHALRTPQARRSTPPSAHTGRAAL